MRYRKKSKNERVVYDDLKFVSYLFHLNSSKMFCYFTVNIDYHPQLSSKISGKNFLFRVILIYLNLGKFEEKLHII